MSKMHRTRADWMGDMGLRHNNATYDDRRNGMLVHIRSQWTRREYLSWESKENRRQLKEWIRPLVEQYPMEKHGRPLFISDEHKLDFYTKWAFTINLWSRDEKRKSNHGGLQADGEIETTDRSNLTDEPELLDTTISPEVQASIEGSGHQDADLSQPNLVNSIAGIPTSMSHAGNNLTIPQVSPAPAGINLMTTAMDWDDIELAINAKAVGCGTIWLPMIDLKPDTTEPCHWKDFDVGKLREHVEADTEKGIDMTIHNLIYTGPEFVEITTNARGSYKIALKWFVERGEGRGKIFHLRVQPKDRVSGIGNGQRARPQGSTLSSAQRADRSEFQKFEHSSSGRTLNEE